MPAFVRLGSVVCLLLASECGGHIADLPAWIGFEEDNEDAVIVLAVTPPASVVLAAGRIEHDGWRSKGPSGRAHLLATDGFLVAKVSPTQDEQAYAIVEVCPNHSASHSDERPSTYTTAFWSVMPSGSPATSATDSSVEQTVRERPAYAPSGEAHLPVLKATAGRVTYVGAITIAATKDAESDGPPAKVGITPAAPDDIEAARRFMAKHYPKVTARIVARPLEMIRNAQLD
jgi:hypothetical protein